MRQRDGSGSCTTLLEFGAPGAATNVEWQSMLPCFTNLSTTFCHLHQRYGSSIRQQKNFGAANDIEQQTMLPPYCIKLFTNPVSLSFATSTIIGTNMKFGSGAAPSRVVLPPIMLIGT